MKRNPLWSSMLAIALLAALAAGGCAKKQTVAEGEEAAPEPTPTVTKTQPRQVRETPIKKPPSQPAPKRTAAVEPAPRAPVPSTTVPPAIHRS